MRTGLAVVVDQGTTQQGYLGTAILGSAAGGNGEGAARWGVGNDTPWTVLPEWAQSEGMVARRAQVDHYGCHSQRAEASKLGGSIIEMCSFAAHSRINQTTLEKKVLDWEDTRSGSRSSQGRREKRYSYDNEKRPPAPFRRSHKRVPQA